MLQLKRRCRRALRHSPVMLTASPLRLLQATVCSMAEGGKHSYQYPRPSLTVDAVIVAAGGGSGSAKLLLIQVGGRLFSGCPLMSGFASARRRINASPLPL